MTPQVWLLAPVLFLTGVLLDVLPRRPRRGVYFGVTTGAEFAASPEGRKLATRHRALVWASTLGAALFLLSPSHPAAFVGAVATQLAGMAAGWLLGHRDARGHAIAPGTARVASLQPDEAFPQRALALIASASVVLAASWTFVVSRYEEFPQRLPVHYNLHGLADRFEDKSWAWVLMPLIVGTCVVALVASNAYWVFVSSRRGGSPETVENRRDHQRLVSNSLSVLSLLVSLMFALIAIGPVLGKGTHLPGGWLMLAFVVAILTVVIRMLVKWNDLPGGSGDDTPDECWKWGLVYWNPQDPAIFVEKRDGVGYTVNFGNSKSWIYVGLAAAVAVLPLVIRKL